MGGESKGNMKVVVTVLRVRVIGRVLGIVVAIEIVVTIAIRIIIDRAKTSPSPPGTV